MFAWGYGDMTSFDLTFITHNLVVYEDAKPFQQNRMPMNPKHSLLVKNNIDKYLKVEFIEPIDYSHWLFKIIPMMKLNGEIRCYF